MFVRVLLSSLSALALTFIPLSFAQNTQSVETSQPLPFDQTGSPNTADTSQAEENFERAFRTLKRQNQLQFELTSRPPLQRSNWLDKFLKPIIDFFAAMTPVFQGLFWVFVGGIVLLFLYIIANALKNVRFNRDKTQGTSGDVAPLYKPSREQARILLDQVDALAAKGLYAEAVHQLLFKSIQDISIARPSIIKRSYTSREISALKLLAPDTRHAFALITREVERSHFGAQQLDKNAFLRCRKAYAQFALEAPKAPALKSDIKSGQTA